ncbi:nSTAND1 domain-containing NTPase [Phormidesmis sp. 146-33]
MSQNNDLDVILQRIEDGQQAEENLAALREILRGSSRREVLQKLAKYNLHIQEVAGGDLQIGDRIYNGWTEQAFDTLLQAIRSQITELLQVQPSKTDLNAEQEIINFGEMPSCPYQGLSAFQEENAEFFFGREAFIEDVVREDGGVRQGLVSAVKTKPLVAVVGASGSGKSSLVFAGLLPRLAQETGWLICKLRPGYPDKRSFHNLAAALLSLKAPEPNADPLVLLSHRAKALRDGTVTLQDVVAEILRYTPTTRCLLLVIDQFEELFTLCAEEERQSLIDVLLVGVKDVPGLKIVLTLRADFCGQAYAYRPLADALHEADLKLGPMNREELRSAIVQPAVKVGMQLEAGLVDRILDDVGREPGSLPLLEFALTQLWAKQKRGQLTHEAYSEIGGVARALANHAEAIYAQLSKEQQKQTQQIFLQLVRLGEGTEDTRRLATHTDVENWELVTLLASAESRLLVTGRNEESGEETVEVVHEALIREWKQLRKWVNDNRDQLRRRRKIEASAEEWKLRDHSTNYLLSERFLIDAKAFQKEQSENLKLSSLAEEFIQRSVKKQRNDRFKLIGFGLVVPLGLAIFVGSTAAKEIRFRQLRIVAEEGQGSQRLRALEELVQANFDLSNIDLHKADLQRAKLINANLRGANFKGANLSGARLSGADLTYGNFTNANLAGASLATADLRGADFGKANLNTADLRGANFRATKLVNANLASANLVGVDLTDANSSNRLTVPHLEYADLTGANLSEANLKGADLSTNILRCGGLSIDLTGVQRDDTTKLPKCGSDPNPR